jgi:quinol monooxygenase YgiN
MTFHNEHTETFEMVFRTYRNAIRSSPGCSHLELWRDKDDPNIYFTFSKWEAAEDLERYRQSETFRAAWSQTKVLFADRPQAWSVNAIIKEHGGT